MEQNGILNAANTHADEAAFRELGILQMRTRSPSARKDERLTRVAEAIDNRKRL
jgi:hypothetical protein